MKKEIENLIKEALRSLGIEAEFTVEHPTDLKMGDYSTNVGIKTGKAKEIFAHLETKFPSEVERVELAGPGFINFYLSKEFFAASLNEIIEKGENFGGNGDLKGEKIMVEHTDPNPFKEFHIGHLMPNVIGSTIARICEWNGAEVKQANYQGDVGLHVAKAVWGVMHGEENPYAAGHKAYEDHKSEIDEINKKIYDKSDPEINKLYEEGKKASLEYFERIYERLGTKFDYYFFESDAGKAGKKIVEENIGKVFEKSEGAIVFRGSHTRVFINSQNLPTYEAKDLGNAKNKYDHYPYDYSVVVTANEIKDYFQVVLEAMKQVLPELAAKTKHITHGMLKLPSGKMSSRTGTIIPAEELIEEVKSKVKGNEQVAIGAIKYMILRQAIGHDIIFDFEKSVSTEGDSGVYLQYAHARANSILEKAHLTPNPSPSSRRGATAGRADGVRYIERLLYRFPEIVERAGAEYAPNYITTYLTELASSFNNFYAHEQIISDEPESKYRLAIVEAFKIVMRNGLNILGIPAPERM
jgi:arginyl-tRNA synthetase